MRYPVFLRANRPGVFIPILLTAACSGLLMTCSNEKPVQPGPGIPEIRVVSATTCKSTDSPPLASASLCTQDCLEYWYGSDSVLYVRHVNAAFNCCMDSVGVSVEIKGHVALIKETDRMESGGCRCLCLYDVEYALKGLPASVEKIEIAEPYAKLDHWLEELPLCCTITPLTKDTGFCCVSRCHYPWGRISVPTVAVTHLSNCKSDSAFNGTYPSDCVVWKYNSDYTLELKRVNTMRNCCLDTIVTRLERRGDTLVIIEADSGPPCDCLCFYDVDYLLTDIEPGKYCFTIRYGPQEGVPTISWCADLGIAPTGDFCSGQDRAVGSRRLTGRGGQPPIIRRISIPHKALRFAFYPRLLGRSWTSKITYQESDTFCIIMAVLVARRHLKGRFKPVVVVGLVLLGLFCMAQLSELTDTCDDCHSGADCSNCAACLCSHSVNFLAESFEVADTQALPTGYAAVGATLVRVDDISSRLDRPPRSIA